MTRTPATPRGVVDLARLVWAARAEASRLHRLAVDSARHRALLDDRLAAQDARVYRCACGAWRYRSTRRAHGSRATCPTCVVLQRPRARARVAA